MLETLLSQMNWALVQGRAVGLFARHKGNMYTVYSAPGTAMQQSKPLYVEMLAVTVCTLSQQSWS